MTAEGPRSEKLQLPLKEARLNKGLSQEEVTSQLGIAQGTYSRWERGLRKIPVDDAKKIAELLGISIEEIAGQAAPPERLDWSPDARSLATGAAISARRRQLKISASQVAASAGIPLEQYQRYEAGIELLSLAAASDLAEALDMSLPQMAGTATESVDFNGRWWAAWQGGPNDPTSIDPHTVDVLRAGHRLLLDQGWRGELEFFGSELLLGWYRPPSRAIRTRLGVFLWVPTGAQYAYGKWTGVSVNNTVASGWCVLSRDEKTSQELIEDLVERDAQPHTPLQLPPFE